MHLAYSSRQRQDLQSIPPVGGAWDELLLLLPDAWPASLFFPAGVVGGVVGGLGVCCHQARPEPRTIMQVSRFRCGC